MNGDKPAATIARSVERSYGPTSRLRGQRAASVTGLALHTLMQGTATTARYTKRYVQVD